MSLSAHGIGQIADSYNHMGINDPQNVWCMCSKWQSSFTPLPISIGPAQDRFARWVLLQFWAINGRVLEQKGELQLAFDGGRFAHLFRSRPIAPGTYRYILELALENLAEFRKKIFMNLAF